MNEVVISERKIKQTHYEYILKWKRDKHKTEKKLGYLQFAQMFEWYARFASVKTST